MSIEGKRKNYLDRRQVKRLRLGIGPSRSSPGSLPVATCSSKPSAPSSADPYRATSIHAPSRSSSNMTGPPPERPPRPSLEREKKSGPLGPLGPIDTRKMLSVDLPPGNAQGP